MISKFIDLGSLMKKPSSLKEDYLSSAFLSCLPLVVSVA